MSEAERKTLLHCEAEGCGARFAARLDPALRGDAASLPAALEAHKAGWLVIEGQILCPACAEGRKPRPGH